MSFLQTFRAASTLPLLFLTISTLFTRSNVNAFTIIHPSFKALSTTTTTTTTLSQSNEASNNQSSSKSKVEKTYAVNAKFKIHPERRNDFLSLIQSNQSKTLSLEPLALQYVVGEDTKNPNTFYIHEEFIGSEGFDAHRATDHNADWATFKNSNPFTEDGGMNLDFYYVDDTHDKSPSVMKFEKIPSDRPAYCLHVELFIKSELRDKFFSVIHNNQRGSYDTSLEPYCLQYTFGESTAEECKFVFHEEYTNEQGGNGDDGFVNHTKTPHFKVWEDFVEEYDPFTKPPVVDFYKTIYDADK